MLFPHRQIYMRSQILIIVEFVEFEIREGAAITRLTQLLMILHRSSYYTITAYICVCLSIAFLFAVHTFHKDHVCVLIQNLGECSICK